MYIHHDGILNKDSFIMQKQLGQTFVSLSVQMDGSAVFSRFSLRSAVFDIPDRGSSAPSVKARVNHL